MFVCVGGSTQSTEHDLDRQEYEGGGVKYTSFWTLWVSSTFGISLIKTIVLFSCRFLLWFTTLGKGWMGQNSYSVKVYGL